jgi:hypothetical protein
VTGVSVRATRLHTFDTCRIFLIFRVSEEVTVCIASSANSMYGSCHEALAAAPTAAVPASWLNLATFGWYRDLRKLIYAKLDRFDRALVVAAHLSNQPVKLNEEFAADCARRGHLALLQWARGLGCPWEKQTCEMAAAGGHLAVLRWALEQGCPCDEVTCRWAAKCGHLPILELAREHGCPWDTMACAMAAFGGHLSVLQWMRVHGCPWDEWTCRMAAEGGHLSVLQWVREYGCPWDASTCASAQLHGHVAVLKWARDNDCPEI